MGSSGSVLRLNEILREFDEEPLDSQTVGQFELYVSLILRWNARMNLTSLRTEDGILYNHLAESIVCAKALPEGVATLLDFGSGAGLPGIPIALCRREIAVTLAESQGKKAAFLHEVVRSLGIKAKVHAGRGETLQEEFDCVVLRAVDKMQKAVAAGARLVAPGGWLALMTTATAVGELHAIAGGLFSWAEAMRLPGSEQRLLTVGHKIR